MPASTPADEIGAPSVEQPRPRRGHRAGGWKSAAAAGALCLFAFAALRPLSCHPGDRLYDPETFTLAYLNRPDVYLHAWVLAWGAHALSTGQLAGFFDANIFHPARDTLAYSEHMLGSLPLFAPVYLATGNLALANNLYALTTFLLTALAAWWVALRWFGSHLAALVAAFAFAFAPWRFAELAHVQLLGTQYLPLVAWVIWESDRRRSAGLWWLLFALVWLQAASSYYLGFLVFVMAGALGAVRLITGGKERGRQALFLGSALGAAALAMLPLSLPYLKTIPVWTQGLRTEGWSVSGYLFPKPLEASGPSWLAWWAVPGVAAVGVALGLANRRLRALAAALLLTAVLGAQLGSGASASLFSLDLGWLHRFAAEWVPGWASLRAFPRFAILAWFSMCFLVALPLGRNARWCGERRWPKRLLGAMLLLALAWPVLTLRLRTMDPPDAAPSIAAERWLAEHGGGAPELHLPARGGKYLAVEGGVIDASYMYWSALHWAPLLNGYSGYEPPSYELILSLANALPEPLAVKTLESLGLVRWLVVHEELLGAQDRKRWTDPRLDERALRHRGPGFRIFELAYPRDRSDALLESGTGASLLGTPLEALQPQDLEAELTILSPGLATRTQLPIPVPVEVRNRSTRPWPAVAVERRGLVGVRFRAREENGSTAPEEQIFSRLPADLRPGESASLIAWLRPPQRPGRYQVVPCLIQESFEAERCESAKATPLRVRRARGPGPSSLRRSPEKTSHP